MVCVETMPLGGRSLSVRIFYARACECVRVWVSVLERKCGGSARTGGRERLRVGK